MHAVPQNRLDDFHQNHGLYQSDQRVAQNPHAHEQEALVTLYQPLLAVGPVHEARVKVGEDQMQNGNDRDRDGELVRLPLRHRAVVLVDGFVAADEDQAAEAAAHRHHRAVDDRRQGADGLWRHSRVAEVVHGEVVGGACERAEGGEEIDDVFFEVSAAGALSENVDKAADADVGGDDHGG